MPADRVHELRLAVSSDGPPGSAGDGLSAVLSAVLSDWTVTPLSSEPDGSWLIAGTVPEHVGSAAYARTAHTLVQQVLHSGMVSRAEADLPVSAYAHPQPTSPPGPAATADCAPGSADPRWAREAIRCDEAWAEPAPPGGRSRGAGVAVGQPDTGYTLHPNLGRAGLDLGRDRDVIDDDNDALDPLVRPAQSPWPLPYPGHGTATASVIVGRGSEQTGIVGVAPEARVVPIRAVESVVQLFDSDVARAVDHARAVGCQVVSMSLGGKGFFGLHRAIQRAVESGMIVMAAAGNDVGIVVAPASYADCLAVAATGVDDLPWPESSRGPAVDVSAPGWCVHVAGYDWSGAEPVPEVHQASGTSYAVAHLAGVAALWLAHHSPAALRQRYGPSLQAAFWQLLVTDGCRVPAGWDGSRWGAGIVDAAALLAAPLPSVDGLAGTGAAEADEVPLTRLGRLLSVGEDQLERALSTRLGQSGERLHETLARFEGELAYHLIEQRGFRDALLAGTIGGRNGDAVRAASSPEFAAAFL